MTFIPLRTLQNDKTGGDLFTVGAGSGAMASVEQWRFRVNNPGTVFQLDAFTTFVGCLPPLAQTCFMVGRQLTVTGLQAEHRTSRNHMACTHVQCYYPLGVFCESRIT